MTHPDMPHDGGEGPAPVVLPPLPADSPGQEGVLGLRIAAALIDLVLLAGLFVIMACAVGQAGAGDGSFNIWLGWGSSTVSLSSGWAVAFVGIVGLYYFGLEAVSGQTVGKRLLDVQVCG